MTDSRLEMLIGALGQLGVSQRDLESLLGEGTELTDREPEDLIAAAEQSGLIPEEDAQNLRLALRCSGEAAELFFRAHLERKPVVLLLKGLEELFKNVREERKAVSLRNNAELAAPAPLQAEGHHASRRDAAAPDDDAFGQFSASSVSPEAEGARAVAAPPGSPTEVSSPYDTRGDEDPREKTQPIGAAPVPDDGAGPALGSEGVKTSRDGGGGRESAPAKRPRNRSLTGRSPYEIITSLGHGRMTQAFKAKCIADGETVVLKRFPPDWAKNREFVDQLFANVRDAITLSHPNVAGLRQIVTSEDECYAVMDYIEGTTLKSLLASGSPLRPLRAITIFRQILEGVKAIHDHDLRHGSLHPGNVILDGAGNVRVLDVGIGALPEPESNADLPEGPRLYQAQYRAPERQLSNAPPTEASDIYELGILLYHMLAWSPPFSDHDLGALAERHANEDLPRLPDSLGRRGATLRDVVAKMTMKSPDDRYTSIEELLGTVKEVESSLQESRTSAPEDDTATDDPGENDAKSPFSRRSRFGRAPTAAGRKQAYVVATVAVIAAILLFLLVPKDPLKNQPRRIVGPANHLSVRGKLDEDIALKLVREGDVALPTLQYGIENGAPEAQVPYVTVLGRIHTPNARSLLMKQLLHKNPKVRAEVALIIGQSRLPAAFEHLAEAVSDADPDVRRNSVIALGLYGDQRAVPLVEKRLEDEDISVQRQARLSLLKLKSLLEVEEPPES